MNKNQDDKVMVIKRGSTLILSSDRRYSEGALERVNKETGCKIVSLTGVRLLGVIPPG